MKITKAVVFFLAIMVSVQLVACSGGGKPAVSSDGISGGTGEATESQPQTNAPDGFSSWMTDGFVKVKGEDSAPKTTVTSYTVYSAKNERESCQVSFRSEKRLSGLTFRMANEDYEGIKVELFWENIVVAAKREWPDALSPLNETFYLRPNKTRSVLIRFSVGKDAGAGEYTYTFELKNKDGIIGIYTVTLHVWNITYPDTPSMSSAVGIEKQAIAYQYGYISEANDPIPEEHSEAIDAIYKEYFDYLLDNRITAFNLPYDILDDRANEYLNDPRLTGIYVSHELDDETLLKTYEKLKSNPEWMAKAYMYPVDEPTSAAMLDDIKEKVDRLRTLCPEMKFATSFFMNLDYDENTDEIGFLADVLDILCLKTKCWRDADMYSAAQAKKYPKMTERTRLLQRQGKTVWSYVCWEPGYPYTNLFVNESGLDHRVLFWQQYDVGSQGFLYWSVNFWKAVNDPWINMSTVNWLDPEVYGDGSLLYNGNHVGITGPCSSKRFEAVRDGVEDYELLKMAEEALGSEWLNGMIDKVTTDMINYTTNDAEFIGTRIAIGDALETALSGKT